MGQRQAKEKRKSVQGLRKDRINRDRDFETGGKGAHGTKATWKGAELQATVPKSFINTAERIKLLPEGAKRKRAGIEEGRESCAWKWVVRMLNQKDGILVQFEH